MSNGAGTPLLARLLTVRVSVSDRIVLRPATDLNHLFLIAFLRIKRKRPLCKRAGVFFFDAEGQLPVTADEVDIRQIGVDGVNRRRLAEGV